MKKIIAQGAEAIIYLEKEIITKDRVAKKYRLKELDEKIRKSRTKKELKILERAIGKVNVPKLIKGESKKFSIRIEYLDGDKLSEKLDHYKKDKQKEVMKKLGIQLAKLHSLDIIHGDLTTSNAILKKEDVYLIDLGLSFISKRIEDRAVDLHLINQALEAKHFRNHKGLFESLIEGYKTYEDCEKVLKQLEKVEARGRYKH